MQSNNGNIRELPVRPIISIKALSRTTHSANVAKSTKGHYWISKYNEIEAYLLSKSRATWLLTSDFRKIFFSHSRLSPSKKKLFYLLQWKSFKNDKNCFLFHLKSSFHSQDIKFLSKLFGQVEKTAWLEI